MNFQIIKKYFFLLQLKDNLIHGSKKLQNEASGTLNTEYNLMINYWWFILKLLKFILYVQ